MAYQSEAQLEQQLIDQLRSQKYEEVSLPDYDSLLSNFITQFEAFNSDRLNNKPLSQKEWERVLNYVNGKSIFESAKILRDKFVLERDDGTKPYLQLLSEDPTKNRYQVTHQTTVVGKYTNRYDVTILINGLPLVQVELKRRGVDIKEAVNQIMRYRKHSYLGLYHFIQMFVVSNGVDTKYFANSDKDILYSHTFFWTDDNNIRITNLKDFSVVFLAHDLLIKMLTRFTILNDTDRIMMVMRPYQVYATEALIRQATLTNRNAYIWHTTGAGKTLTSFKTAQILATIPTIKKVIFLVDRKDLDTQTTEEFNKFEAGSVDTTDRTEKFRLPDGGRIQVTDDEGKTREHTCRYIDDYHFETSGGGIYHICEFAERLQMSGSEVRPLSPTIDVKAQSRQPKWKKIYDSELDSIPEEYRLPTAKLEELKDRVIQAMKLAGYELNSIETDYGCIRFNGESQVIFGGWKEAEVWLDNAFVDDPDLCKQISEVLHKGEPEEMTVLVIEPKKEPYVKTISSGLESLQREVGGYIEAIYPFSDPVALICNEEGKLEGLALNRGIYDDADRLYDIVCGTMLVVGLGEDNFSSLSPLRKRMGLSMSMMTFGRSSSQKASRARKSSLSMRQTPRRKRRSSSQRSEPVRCESLLAQRQSSEPVRMCRIDL